MKKNDENNGKRTHIRRVVAYSLWGLFIGGSITAFLRQ